MFARLLIGTLLLSLFISGCSRSLGTKGEVSGKVSYNGKPLPGGQVTFMTPQGYGFSSPIDSEGNYKLQALTGEARISVDNQMLKKGNESTSPAAIRRRMGMEPAPGVKMDEPPPSTLTGTYVPIPDKYRSPDQSGLKYTVTSGSQTHNIDLSAPGS